MNVVLCYSGGLDSTCLLYHLLDRGHRVRCLAVDYGQRHHKELQAAAEIAGQVGADLQLADLSGAARLFAGSSQTSEDVPVPEGHYAEESMKATVVPNRNMVLLSLAVAWAVSTKSQAVAYAAHGGDHAIYPDCRPAFAEAMAEAVRLCDWHPVELVRPFLEPTMMDKADIVRMGARLGVPFALTWSCYKGGAIHCGKCGTCVERREAFAVAEVADPTRYLTDHFKEE